MSHVMSVTHQNLLHIFCGFALNTTHNAKFCRRTCARSASMWIPQTSSATQKHRVMFNVLSTRQIEPSKQNYQQYDVALKDRWCRSANLTPHYNNNNSWSEHVCFMSVYLFVRVLLDVVFQLIKAELKQWLIGQCSLWGYDNFKIHFIRQWICLTHLSSVILLSRPYLWMIYRQIFQQHIFPVLYFRQQRSIWKMWLLMLEKTKENCSQTKSKLFMSNVRTSW